MRPFIAALVTAVAALSVGACNERPSGSDQPAPAAQAPDTAAAPAADSPGSPHATTAGAQATRPAGRVFTGTIAEAMNTSGYTYARLEGGPEDIWIAATEFNAVVGEQVTVSLDLPMEEFDSKTLNRHFKLLYFVTEVARGGQPLSTPSAASGPSLMTSHGAGGSAETGAPAVARLDPPAGGISIADAFAKRATLAGKPVTVSGTVVKFNSGILDRNWIHLQDGSGSADAHDNDLTVTTDAVAQVGDVVTVSGVLRTNQDFGAGYAYDVILERAAVSRR